MKTPLLYLALLLLLSAFAVGQIASIPTCDGFNAAGAPVVAATGSTNCTDYWGSGNWANSPLPAGSIASFTIFTAGSGYNNPVVNISDPTGSGSTATATIDPGTGAITAVNLGAGGTGYIVPQITIVDTLCGGIAQPVCGSGATVIANLGGPFTGGMLKFQDALPDLKGAIAVPDTVTFPNSDFYVIGLTQYSQQMHASLPPTTLRGYVQLNSGTDPTTNLNTLPPPPQSYLGPVILAQRDRPVRVLFKNMLPTGAGGNLFIPVDPTYMGAGMDMTMMGYTQNRGTLHLHGGNTPWISDGTPHQWTAPAGEIGPQRGVSTQFVPDMWFDANGSVIASCAGQTTCNVTGATNDPGAGAMTFYWTNQESGRLLFYHDHAYGITRLNVYVGEAAGYLIVDPTEEAGLQAATAPGTVSAGDLTHIIPLVIQDKTFVPSAAQIGFQDPTWALNFGLTPGTPKEGDVWFPHVYMTNQNPFDPTGGNGFGRWDYGAWFTPAPMKTLLAANPPSAVTVNCTSSAFPGQTVGPTLACPTCGCPIIPNPSGTPESFMDTPLVNGKAYPVLHVAPAAYRFHILSAGNDRSLNLSWFIADSTQGNTEVAMLPAAPPITGSALPLCGPINGLTIPSLVIGLPTALLDAGGNPLNGTGLPANCWPNYGRASGIPAIQGMWPADGRAGGVPDPRTAGPAWIQIGTEAGLLPAPVVIPATPTNYEFNTRSVTITNVGVHGLWLGPAERADVIVDFSQFSGKTLILYNDAPTPAPAEDSRLDYFTGDGDQSPIGGAPNTQPGYGPNTRTIMQVVVDGTGPSSAPNLMPFSLAALKRAFASTATTTGLFAQVQATEIVPEAALDSAYNANFPNVYTGIQSDTFTFTPIVPQNLSAPCPATLPAICDNMDRKTIQELFTADYGRMNATLGTELPFSSFLTQTTIPLGYIDPPTEFVKKGDTQLWKITHNGVDTHFIHFHLFDVEVINRMGWDGTTRPPEANEVGWKDTVRMNPLEDILVAVKPHGQNLPWPLPNSVRLMDVTAPVGSDCASANVPGCSQFTNVDPFTNNAATTLNALTNFGQEYVWHCHILGHEENDMMRAIVYQVPPAAPSNLTAAALTGGGVQLTFTDNSASETGFTVQRDTDPAFPAPLLIAVAPSTPTNGAGEGTSWGGPISVVDTAPMTANLTYYYQVQAVDDGFGVPMEQPFNATAALLSGWSNIATVVPVPIAGITPTSVPFGNVVVNTTAGPQTVALANSGTADLIFTINAPSGANAGDFAVVSNTCVSPLTAGTACSFGVTFTPSAVGARSAAVTITSNDPVNPTLNVALSGTGISNTSVAINAPAINYGANGVVTVTVSATGGTPSGNVTLSVDGGVAVSAPLVGGSATFDNTNVPALLAPVAGNHTLTANYAAQGFFTASTANGTLLVNPATLTITASSAAMNYGATVPAITPLYSGFVLGQTSAVLTAQPTCSTTALASSPVGSYPSSCSGAVAANYTINYVAGTITVNPVALTITASSGTMNYGGTVPVITAGYSGFVNGDTAASLTTAPTCSTMALSTSPVGSYPSTCSGAVDANYTIGYVAGSVSVTADPLTITASSGTMVYGGTAPVITAGYSGFLNGDSAASLTAAPICSTTATALSNVGSYPSSCSGAAATNYNIIYVAGSVAVTPAPVVVTASSAPMTYGGPVPVITPGFSGFVNGQNNTVLTVQPICITAATSTSPVGSYSSSCSGAAAVNYSFSYVPGTVTVGKATSVAAISAHLPNPSIIGQIVTVSFAVTPQFSGVPTGSVTVLAGTGESCVGSLSSGVGRCNITFTTGGSRTLTATYGGDTNFFSSPASAPVTHAVSGVSLSTFSLLFGNQLLNTTSAAQTVTLANVGTTTLAINSIATTGDFAYTTNCGTTLGVGRSCRINVTFRPTALGVRTGNLTITDSDPTSPQIVTLTGTGVQPAAVLTPTSNNFGTVRRGQSSAPFAFTLSNPGTGPLTINNITLGGTNAGQFSQTNNCGNRLAAGANCTINVTFSPKGRGAYSATLNVADNAPGSPQSAALSGTGQ